MADYNFVGYDLNSQIPVDEKTAEKELKKIQKATECVDWMSEGDYMTAIASDFTSAPTDMNARDALTECGWDEPIAGSFGDALDLFWINSDLLGNAETRSTYNFAESSYWDFGAQNNFVKDPRGMEYIAEKFAETRGLLDKKLIQFGKEVTAINYPNDPTALASVTTSDQCVYQAKTIIFTPSLEVTQKMEESGVFNPPLTPSCTVNPLKLDSWVRIFYKFEETFWINDVDWLLIGTQTRNECSVWLNYDTPDIYPGSGIISCVLDQTAFENALNGAPLTEEIATQRFLEPLRATYGATIPAPTQVMWTDWENDPISYGSWENFPYGEDLTGFYEYTQPRNNKLFLSGSGTCLRYWGFMHGAYLAGQRDAEWAIKTMNGEPSPPYSMCDDMGEI